MFMMIGKDNCPSCGVESKVWKKNPTVFMCPKCKSVFSEFGVVSKSGSNRIDVS